MKNLVRKNIELKKTNIFLITFFITFSTISVLKLFDEDVSFSENELLKRTPRTTEINKIIKEPIIVSLLKSIPPNILFDIPKFKKN